MVSYEYSYINIMSEDTVCTTMPDHFLFKFLYLANGVGSNFEVDITIHCH